MNNLRSCRLTSGCIGIITVINNISFLKTVIYYTVVNNEFSIGVPDLKQFPFILYSFTAENIIT